jgi:hypothetical protein
MIRLMSMSTMRKLVSWFVIFLGLYAAFAVLLFRDWSSQTYGLPLDGMGITSEHQLNALAVLLATLAVFGFRRIARWLDGRSPRNAAK